MAAVVPVGEPVNEDERRVIAYLRDNLSSGYTLMHNFEIHRNGEVFEVDLAVIAPHAVYLVDVKGTRGLIEVYGSKWYPERRQPFASPLIKLRGHARTLKGLITASQPNRRDLDGVYVDAAVVLAAPDAVIQDPGGRDAPSVTTLAKSVAFFQNTARIPAKFSKNIAGVQAMVRKAVQGAAHARTGPLRFNSWEVEERLGGTDAYTEYRAFNSYAGAKSGHVLLRVYVADPYLPKEERAGQRTRIANAYKALNHMPGHPAIVGVRDFFATEGEDRYVLVTEDVAGQALRLHIDRPNLALTFDQKLAVTDELLDALAHAHQHQVVHRNITPGTLLLGADGHLHVIGFEFARAGVDRSKTIAQAIVDDLEPLYQAPETFREPANASPASDVYSAGLVLYELFTGEKPFSSPTDVYDQGGVFPAKPSDLRSEVPTAIDNWLQKLCSFDPDQRPSAAQANEDLRGLLAARDSDDFGGEPLATPAETEAASLVDYGRLVPGTMLTSKYLVEKRIGAGSFGVVYKVIDTLGDVPRAVKVILKDRHSTLERLKKEYRTLLRVPEHPNVVRVYDAQFSDSGFPPPFIVFEYIDGLDISEMINQKLFSPDDALDLAKQVTDGLVHLHRHGAYHCDIKPRNLLWTSNGVRIIDFNVSVLRNVDNGHGGGSDRYLPPDLDRTAYPQPGDLADRDLFALGVTLFEAITGRYPWEAAAPPPGVPAADPREFSGLADLAPAFVDVVLRTIAPKRADRFASATELQSAFGKIMQAVRSRPKPDRTGTILSPGDTGASPPNTNPYVSRLLTLYSQSAHSNAGTRGLDTLAERTYVETALDRELEPAVLAGEFRLVIITGNAGDGKTAFLQRLENRAREQQARFAAPLPNGRRFTLRGRTFVTNYDGSQDEGEQSSDDVLTEFFAPFAGSDPEAWSDREARLIAINEGRLVDFLAANAARFPLLDQVVRNGLVTGAPEHGVAVVNLNLRSVVHDPLGYDGDEHDGDESIFARTLRRLTHEGFWEPCQRCDLRDRCYAYHNARTFQDPVAGPKVIERLKTAYTLTHLRGRLHITLRDMRSALAYMLVGTRDCGQIHELYQAGDRETILQGFYFNSWLGGDRTTGDRLLDLLKDVDMGVSSDPRLDRGLDFISPAADRTLFRFDLRGAYDRDVLRSLFAELPRDYSGQATERRGEVHRQYVAMARRRAYFERRDPGWRQMLPYRSAERMMNLIAGRSDLVAALADVLHAINRGEGLNNLGQVEGKLALQVRQVERGTVRSYRMFPAERFSFSVVDAASRARFVEHMPASLMLRHQATTGSSAELLVNLDVFEMLERLNAGYRPSVEEEQGYYLSLAVFKNRLGSEPYQEVMLTTTGHDFYRVERHDDGRLEMSQVTGTPEGRR
ncbi:methylation-associated defense system protein kinase MAD6 [Verrucosispora sp. WMMD703]|uniref:methylation-associated defense system protein kinase MAD6 n=1 Tax=Verrucosispora sp. WMMD703 TaxID=3403463 RepID=UPI003B9640E2